MIALARAFGERARAYATSRERNEGDLLQRLLEHLDPVAEETLLDLGAGAGPLALAAAPFVRRTVALDLSTEMLAATRLAFLRAQRPVPPRVAADARRLPFRDGVFDLIGSRDAVRHFGDLPAALAEARRLLSRGGRLGIADVARWGEPATDAVIAALEALHAPAPVVLLDAGEWRAALGAAGLRVDWIEEPLYERAEGRSLIQWMAEAGAAQETFERAKRLLLDAPPLARENLRVLEHGTDVNWHPPRLLAVAKRIA